MWREKHCGQIKSKQLPTSELPQRSKMITYQLLTPRPPKFNILVQRTEIVFSKFFDKNHQKSEKKHGLF